MLQESISEEQRGLLRLSAVHPTIEQFWTLYKLRKSSRVGPSKKDHSGGCPEAKHWHRIATRLKQSSMYCCMVSCYKLESGIGGRVRMLSVSVSNYGQLSNITTMMIINIVTAKHFQACH